MYKKKLLLVQIALACLISLFGCSKQPDKKPNILFISIDSLRWDHLSCYGYFRETTPNIDKLAAKGTLFDNAISTTCWTLPSHISMFTGLYNMQHGVDDDGKALSPAIKTLPQFMKENGYYTYGIFSGPYLHPAFGFARGFDQYIDCSSSKKFVKEDTSYKDIKPLLLKIHDRSHKDITNYNVFAAFSQWFGRKTNEKPFFAFIHLWDVHYDYIPPPPYDKIFDPHYQGTITGEVFMGNPRVVPDMCSRDLEHIIALYDGEILWTDHIIGKMMDLLTKSGDSKNTMIIITSDHGDEFFEHGFKGHSNLFDENIRVPLIIYYPKVFPQKKVEYQVSHISILPTILDITGIDIPKYLPNPSLKKIIDENITESPLLLAEFEHHNSDVKAIRDVNWKFIYDIEHNKTMFFDLLSDPGEKNSLIPLQEPIVISDFVREKVLKSLKFYGKINASVPYFQSKKAAKPELDKATKEHLKSLGYID